MPAARCSAAGHFLGKVIRVIRRAEVIAVARHDDRVKGFMMARSAHGGLTEAGGDHRDLDRVFHFFVEHSAEDDVGVFVSRALNNGASLLHFGELQ